MTSKKEVLDALKKGDNDDWRIFLSNLTTHELSDVLKTVADIRSELKSAVERMEDAQLFLDSEIEKRQLKAERAKRKQSRAKPKTSLREFLMQPQTERDIPFKQLSLCTKSGATVALCALTFKLGDNGQRTEMANEAKRLFQERIEVSAPLWDLYFLKDGQRSAGFGWERPFLDEVYVIAPAVE